MDEQEEITPHTIKDIRRLLRPVVRLVDSWPKWKQNIIEQSASPTVSTPRKPVVNK